MTPSIIYIFLQVVAQWLAIRKQIFTCQILGNVAKVRLRYPFLYLFSFPQTLILLDPPERRCKMYPFLKSPRLRMGLLLLGLLLLDVLTFFYIYSFAFCYQVRTIHQLWYSAPTSGHHRQWETFRSRHPLVWSFYYICTFNCTFCNSSTTPTWLESAYSFPSDLPGGVGDFSFHPAKLFFSWITFRLFKRLTGNIAPSQSLHLVIKTPLKFRCNDWKQYGVIWNCLHEINATKTSLFKLLCSRETVYNATRLIVHTCKTQNIKKAVEYSSNHPVSYVLQF